MRDFPSLTRTGTATFRGEEDDEERTGAGMDEEGKEEVDDERG